MKNDPEQPFKKTYNIIECFHRAAEEVLGIKGKRKTERYGELMNLKNLQRKKCVIFEVVKFEICIDKGIYKKKEKRSEENGKNGTK